MATQNQVVRENGVEEHSWWANVSETVASWVDAPASPFQPLGIKSSDISINAAVEDLGDAVADFGQATAQAIDDPASPFSAIGVKSGTFSCESIGKGFEEIGEVGKSVAETPCHAVDGLGEGLKNVDVCGIPNTAIDGINSALRHTPKPVERVPQFPT
mmetsp:Transcript_39356/g.61354  ORF Transcript_39356/g.61354 Transcript_39356/m.61354 type:complete len:158 (-) Transcript_39356:44-517(-)|eukprot:CAMPEP_0184327422 /NCGR_PEP_ID=MMETSP1049-20130417/143085_1 /TAXON_ID=77928 /ORGANISM="Proteomonas sulcata, Strain CCMP704" /LENGTH=157 /DNA_ID=CAMNT_0026649679 /DNA_START=1044 /DNA_END=1517 /DNA_ORIENTATION=+